MLIALIMLSCSCFQSRFEKSESTPNARYSIVIWEGKFDYRREVANYMKRCDLDCANTYSRYVENDMDKDEI